MRGWLLAALMGMAACTAVPETSMPVKAPDKVPERHYNAPDRELDTTGLQVLQTPSRSVHFFVPNEVALREWRGGFDTEIMKEKPILGRAIRLATDDRLLFAREQGDTLALMPVRFTERRDSDGLRAAQWLDETLAYYAKKSGYQLVTREQYPWPGERDTAFVQKALVRFEQDSRPFEGSVYLFKHGNTLTRFVYEAPEASYVAMNPSFIRMMRSVQVGPAGAGTHAK